MAVEGQTISVSHLEHQNKNMSLGGLMKVGISQALEETRVRREMKWGGGRAWDRKEKSCKGRILSEEKADQDKVDGE